MLLADPELEAKLLENRRAWGGDKFDEVWDGVYVMHAYPGDQHQELVSRFTHLLHVVVEDGGLGKVRPGVNIASDRDNWTHDFRCPDIVAFLNDTAAVCCDSFWFGGPDFAIEVISRGDEARTKIGFYAKVNTRELLLVDRDPWRLELYRHDGTGMPLVAECDLSGPRIASEVLPFSMELRAGGERPVIVVASSADDREWVV